MTAENEEAKSTTNMWDVAMYIVQRFPVIAMGALLAAGVGYGLNLIWEQKNQAEKELLDARLEIEAERTSAGRLLDQERASAAAALAEAAEKERAAIVRAERARADALTEVQDTLLTASERIQNLVLGQLKSMEDLENLRALAASEMQAELEDLENRRNEMQTALDKAERSIRVARLTFAIDSLEEAIEGNLFFVDEAIDRVVESFEVGDAVALEEIDRKISQETDPVLRGSLEYALALKTGTPDWAQRFATTLEANPAAFGQVWFDSMFGCCDTINEPMWSELFPVIAKLSADDELPARTRIALMPFFGNRPMSWQGPLFSETGYADRHEVWEVLAFIIEIAKGDHPQVSPYQRARVPTLLFEFDLAAAHVWAAWLVEGNRLPEDEHETVLQFLEGWVETYPILSSSPSPELMAFWTSNELVSVRGEYAERGTSADYSKQ